MKIIKLQIVIISLNSVKMLCSHRILGEIRLTSINSSSVKIFIFEVLIRHDCVFKIFATFFKIFISVITGRSRR